MDNKNIIQTVTNAFQSQFGIPALLVRSPGRVNLIGEHTDYNDGFVLPGAIDKAIYFAFSLRNDNEIHLNALDFESNAIAHLSNIEKSNLQWPNYILGVIDEIQKRGKTISGFNCTFSGDIPAGAGLSSSAALECGIAFGLNTLFDLQLSKIDLIKISQGAENNFVGLNSGIMDQFASMLGKANNVLKLDCKTLEFEYKPFLMDAYKIVLFDTNVKHTLASSEYNTRRKECEAGVHSIQKKFPEITSLRDATLDMLYASEQDSTIQKRCKYVIEEKQRMIDGCAMLEQNDLAGFGKKMFATHDGLSKEYDVSCPELDFLVDFVRENPNVLGARMMGGGFGGCTINLVKKEAVENLIPLISAAYQKQTGLELKTYIASLEDGTSVLN